MSFRLSLYSLAAFTIPGIFYILIFIFSLDIFEIMNIGVDFNDISLNWFILIIFSAYFVGHLMDYVAFRWSKLFIGGSDNISKKSLEAFRKRHSQFKDIIESDNWRLMLHFIQIKNMELAEKIEEDNVTSILLRAISFLLVILAIIIFLHFLFVSNNSRDFIFVCVSILFSIISMKRTYVFKMRFYQKIYETFVTFHMLGDDTFVPLMKFQELRVLKNNKRIRKSKFVSNG